MSRNNINILLTCPYHSIFATLFMSTLSKNTAFQVELSTRQIIKMAAPISFAILIPQINYVTNNIFLGHYSKQALAVAGVTGVYYLIFSAIGYGLNNGLQALIARPLTKKCWAWRLVRLMAGGLM